MNCCAFIIVIFVVKRIIAAVADATINADVNPIVIAGETNDRMDTLMIPRTNKIQVFKQNKHSLLEFNIKSP